MFEFVLPEDTKALSWSSQAPGRRHFDPLIMRFITPFLLEAVFEARRWVSRRLRSPARPVALAQGFCFLAEARSFHLANPAAPISAAPGREALAQRASELLRHGADRLLQSARSLDQETLDEAPSGPRAIAVAREAMGGLLIAQERQRRALSDEREALCLLAFHCARLLSKPPPSGHACDRELDAPQPLLGGKTLLSFFVASRQVDFCGLLLTLGADPEALDHDGRAPMALAENAARSLEGGAGRALAAGAEARAVVSLLQQGVLERSASLAPRSSARRL